MELQARATTPSVSSGAGIEPGFMHAGQALYPLSPSQPQTLILTARADA